MTKAELREEILAAKVNAFAYKAALYCRPCTEKIVDELLAEDRIPQPDEATFQDTETVPQPDVLEDAAGVQCCDSCCDYLYGDDWEDDEDDEDAEDDYFESI